MGVFMGYKINLIFMNDGLTLNEIIIKILKLNLENNFDNIFGDYNE